jgi:hypothetical protein
MDNSKVQHGQFYTETNPFGHDAFFRWISLMKKYDKSAYESVWLEPWAGANNIVEHMQDVQVHNAIPAAWACFDIDPETQDENTSGVSVQTQDTIKNFPTGYTVNISNPPWLAKNSATEKKLSFPNTVYDDLYKVCLDLALTHNRWVALIIPESFITQGLFHDRLITVISLTCKMFEATDVPACLALFVPIEVKQEHTDLKPLDFKVYIGKRYAGHFESLQNKKPTANKHLPWKFNDTQGEIGLRALDNTEKASICFVTGQSLVDVKITGSSRSITRISGVSKNIDLALLIKKANFILRLYRKTTKDILLTAFKGLRKDKKYRRRLDWQTARDILDKAVEEMSA